MSVCNTMTIAVRTSHKTLRRRGILLLAGCSSHLVKHVYIHGSWTTKANYNGCQVGSRREEAGCGIATPAPGHSVGGSWSESTSRWRSLLNVATLGYITFLALFTYLCECSVAHTSSKHFTHKCAISIITKLHVRKEKAEGLQQITVVFHGSYILVKTRCTCSYGILE